MVKDHNIEKLRSIELKLLDELTGMNSGYVLDFTNSTFAEFFRTEVGIDIYDDVYAGGGKSKGKRLRSFLQIGQPAAIVKVLAALWEYRESDIINHGKVECVANARHRLSTIVERLGSPSLANHEVLNTPSPMHKAAGPDAVRIENLEERFLALHNMSAQARGYAFEKFLTGLFDAWEMDARSGFRVAGEQIDGSFQHEGTTYLVEAKWESKQSCAATLHAFQGKLEERPQWTRGLFISYQGFTESALQAFTARRVILMDGMDIYDALRRRIPLPDIVTLKARHASEYKKPFERVRNLFQE